MKTAYDRYITGTFLPKLELIKQQISFYGKDYTNAELADMFDVSVKTFNKFYAGELIRFDLLINLGSMYGFEFNL